MSINIGIIDAQATKLAEDLKEEWDERLGIRNDPVKQRSVAFLFLVVRTILDVADVDALDCLTEGGNDFGVDAIDVGSVEDNEFQVTLFQAKYVNEANGTNAFPQSGIEKAVQAIKYLFDPNATITTNPMLTARVEDIRSLVRDGHIPRVRAIMCSNGTDWGDESKEIIQQSGFPTDQVTWEYVNHDRLVKLMQAVKTVDDTLPLTGKAIVEDFDYCRVLVGKIKVQEIAALFNRHGDLLLDRNIRRFLGMQGNRVNTAISATLSEKSERPNFYFYNNGITLLCNKFAYNALQSEHFQVVTQGLQIINGGQTCRTIQKTIADLAGANVDELDKAFVLVRIYELPKDSEDLVRSITYATNSQNPVDLRDLRSNDARQKSLEIDIATLKNLAGASFEYLRNRTDSPRSRLQIKSTRAAEAVLAVWRKLPHQARTQNRELFGQLYETIFSEDLNGSQAVLATVLFRFAEKKRQRPGDDAPGWISYASHFVAMLMGQYLLDALIEDHLQVEIGNDDDIDDLNNARLPASLKAALSGCEPKLKARTVLVEVVQAGVRWNVSDERTDFLVTTSDGSFVVKRRFTLRKLNHNSFPDALKKWERNDESYHARALIEVQQAIDALYGGQQVSLQQLAATFRRGDLLTRLPQ